MCVLPSRGIVVGLSLSSLAADYPFLDGMRLRI
nr:MAG TPA: hypothetical protein [Caudoviricetes sp.]